MLEFLIPTALGLVLSLVIRFSAQRRLEQRSWGERRSALSRADRREIRRAVREGRPVGDQALALPAVRFGEAARSASARAAGFRGAPPHWIYIFGRIFFPVLGTFALVDGILRHDGTGVFSGVVLLAFTVMYLPDSERWTKARRARRDHRLQLSIEANRRLSTGT